MTSNKINFDIFDIARQRYHNTSPFLTAQREAANRERPYNGLRIIDNTPLTLTTLLKIEVLLLGGADVTVRLSDVLPASQPMIDLLKAANVKLCTNNQFPTAYDFHLDCCAELLAHTIPPTRGATELTQTGEVLYQQKKLGYPVISINDSPIKSLETFFGTGDGLVRALQNLFGDKIHGQSFVIFGCGRVGSGITHALKKIGCAITVIDKKIPPATPLYQGISFVAHNDKSAIMKAIQNAYCIVTATGVPCIVSDYYQLNEQHVGNAILANMGAEDEYGQHFSPSRVLFNKKPINFSLEEPTLMKYLDPIFYAHNAGIDLILTQEMQPGYHPFPDVIATAMLTQWETIYQEDTQNFTRNREQHNESYKKRD